MRHVAHFSALADGVGVHIMSTERQYYNLQNQKDFSSLIPASSCSPDI